jgi:cytochrome bd-type quinol oxidase subunit 2
MQARATLKAVAFLLNGAVFLVGVARLQGHLAPPDYIFVGLLFAAPLVSWLTLLLSYRKRLDPEVAATAKAATLVLNVLLLTFVVWLTARLDPDTRSEEALWLVLLFATPPVNALAILRSSPGRRESAETVVT